MDVPLIEKLLVQVAIYSICLPIMAGIWNFKKIDLPQKRLLLYLPISLSIDLYGSWLGLHHINNMPLFHLGTLLEFLFLSYIFYLSFTSKTYRQLISVLSVVFLSFHLLWLIYFANIFNFNHESRILQCIILITYSLLYFNMLSKEISIKQVKFKSIPMFWFSLGILLYFTGNFFLFLLYKYITAIEPTIWVFHSILNITTNILFFISFLCRTK